MTITVEAGLYDRHLETAVRILGEVYEHPDYGGWGEPREGIATAQVHATLAVAAAINRLADSYNGWKDLGR